MSATETGMQDVAGRVRIPKPPGAESVGPPITDLVLATEQLRRIADALYAQARGEAQERFYIIDKSGQTDSNGDSAIELFQVPQGATGYLCFAVVDEAAETPASPDSQAAMWLGIGWGAPGGSQLSQVYRQGGLLDFHPFGDTNYTPQIPTRFMYGDRHCAPALVGPLAFYGLVDGATAARALRWHANILVVQPEP